MSAAEPIEILVGYEADGVVYQIRPRDKRRILALALPTKPVRRVFIGYDTKEQFEQTYGPIVEQAVILLTGLTSKQINDLGGLRIKSPSSDKPIFEGMIEETAA